MSLNIYNKLTEEEKTVFNSYKNGAFSFKLNEDLRQRRKTSYTEEIKILDSIIGRRELEESCQLFRATIETDIIPFIKDGKYVNPEYLSTSTKLTGIKKFFNESNGAVFLIIYCSKGTKFADMEENELNGMDEHEVLLGRNNEFLIIEDLYITDKSTIREIAGWKGHDIDKMRKISVRTNP